MSQCIACGTGALLGLEAKDINRHLSDASFVYLRCPNCGLLFLRPVPSDLAAYYPNDYYTRPRSLDRLAEIAAQQWYEIDLLRRYVEGGRLVEIGPAYGAFAYLAQKAGFDVTVIEMDSECCRFLENVVGVHAIHSSEPASALGRLPAPDAIVLWHVIEHLPDPFEFMNAAAEALAPGGVLLMAAPNPRSLQFRIFGPRWVHLDAPRHLQLIPASVVRERLANVGLNRELETSIDIGGLLWNVFGWRRSFANLAGRRSRVKARVLGTLGLLLSPLLAIGDLALGGSTYTVVYRKGAA